MAIGYRVEGFAVALQPTFNTVDVPFAVYQSGTQQTSFKA